MQQDVILVFDLGSEENPMIAREIRALGVYSEIHPHDLTASQLAQIPNIRGIILNGGKNRVVDGVEIDASDDIYALNVPVLAVDHAAKKGEMLTAWPADENERKALRQDLEHRKFHRRPDCPRSQAGRRRQGSASSVGRRGLLRCCRPAHQGAGRG